MNKPNKPALKKLVTAACAGLVSVSPETLLAAFTPADLEDFGTMHDPLTYLRMMAESVAVLEWRDAGIAPPWWDKTGHCKKCGPVYLWEGVTVPVCPWCINRKVGRKIPRPAKVGA